MTGEIPPEKQSWRSRLERDGLKTELVFQDQRYEIFETLDHRAGSIEAALARARAIYPTFRLIGKKVTPAYQSLQPACIGHLYIQADEPRFTP